MRIGTFVGPAGPAVAIVEGERLLDLAAAYTHTREGSGPSSVRALIEGGAALLGEVSEVVAAAKVAPFESGLWRRLAECRLLAPIPRPSKNVFCVGRNYKLHIEEGARARGVAPTYPSVPEFFSKPPTAVIGHEAEIRVGQAVTQQLDYEVELALVIGRTCRDVARNGAREAVFGYTVVNDVTARDLQRTHGQWFKGKGLDTCCPIGPWIVTADEFGSPSGHRITLRVNGETRQDSTTSDLLFDCDAIVESLSAGLTLEAGDIICTGTPSGVALGMTPQPWLKEGDVLEAEIEGIGILRNTVRRPG